MKILRNLLWVGAGIAAATAHAIPAVWDTTLGGELNDTGQSIINCRDGGYLVAGYSSSPAGSGKAQDSKGGNDFWVARLQEDGQLLWDRTLGGTGDDRAYCAAAVEGGYIVAGRSNSPLGGDKTEDSEGGYDFWILKISAIGEIIWDRTIGGSGWDQANAMTPTADGGYIIAGDSYSGIGGSKSQSNQGACDFWVVKLASDGSLIWDSTFGGNAEDRATSIVNAPDSGYAVAGYTISSDIDTRLPENGLLPDFWLVKIDDAGEIVWNQCYGNAENDMATSMLATDSGYTLAGSKGDDYWILGTDLTGTQLWESRIGGSNTDQLKAIAETTDDGYVLAGYSDSGKSGDKTSDCLGQFDYWIVRTDETGTVKRDYVFGGTGIDMPFGIAAGLRDTFVVAGSSVSEINIIGERLTPPKGSGDYWCIKYMDAETMGRYFTEKLPATHLQPTNGITITDHTPLLSWHDPAGIFNSTTILIMQNGKKIVEHRQHSEHRAFQVMEYLPAGEYNWWVYCFSSYYNGPNGWSSLGIFTIALTPPGNVLTTQPANGELIDSRMPLLKWEQQGHDADWYHVTAINDGKVVVDKWLKEQELQLDQALPGGNYNWWVQPWNPDGTGAWSSKASFSIDKGTPEPPELRAPLNSNELPGITYIWGHDTNATWFEVWYENTLLPHANFYIWPFEDKTINPVSQWLKAEDLTTTGTTSIYESRAFKWGHYRWCVRGWSPDGMGKWSTVEEFDIGATKPIDGTPPGEFSWEEGTTEYAEWYHLAIESIGYAKWIKQDETTMSGKIRSFSTAINGSNMDDFTWSIRAWDSDLGMGPWTTATFEQPDNK